MLHRDRENIFPLFFLLYFLLFFLFFPPIGIKTCVFDRFRTGSDRSRYRGQDPTDFVPAGVRQILTFRSFETRVDRNRFQTVSKRRKELRSLALWRAEFPHEPSLSREGGSTTIGRVARPLCLDSRYWLWGEIYSRDLQGNSPFFPQFFLSLSLLFLVEHNCRRGARESSWENSLIRRRERCKSWHITRMK